MNKINNRAIFEALEYVLYKKMEKEAEAMLRLCPTVEHDEECYRAVKAQIDEHFKKLERKALKSRVIVAIVAAVLALLTSCAVIFREEIGGFIVTFFEGNADFEGGGSIAKEIDVYYEPTYVPEGYSSIEKDISDLYAVYGYSNGERTLYFEQYLSSGSNSIDTQNAVYGEATVGDKELFYSYREEKKTVSMIWRNQNCSFFLSCSSELAPDEIERIILGIQPIDAATSTK